MLVGSHYEITIFRTSSKSIFIYWQRVLGSEMFITSRKALSEKSFASVDTSMPQNWWKTTKASCGIDHEI